MNQGKKRKAATLLASLLLATGGVMAQAPDNLPLILTLKTNIYGYQGPNNAFTIYLGSTKPDVEVYVESASTQEYVSLDPWSVGQDENGDNAAIATAIGLNVTEKDNEIRIYGDDSLIDFIDVHGCYLSSVVLNAKFPNLTVIDLSHNELTAIDLSAQSALASIDLEDNEFNDASKMVIGTNHPMLEILKVGVNAVCDPQLSLTNFPALQYFSARNNFGIFDVDPTQCPNLVSLVLEITNVSSIDVSKNPNLDVLNLSQTRINSVDVSKNTKLGELYINHEGSFNNEDQYRVSSINLKNNPLLEYLDLGGNALTSIDLSNNPKIKMLYLQRNKLSSIDVSKITALSVFNISNNLFTFANLPIPQEGWDYYYYTSPLPCELKYKVGSPIDFSASVIRAPFVNSEGTTITPKTYATVFVVPQGQDEYELEEDAFSFDKGIITFNQAVADSVYVQFFCDVFDEWPLSTQNFMVKTPEDFDAPSAVFSFLPSKNMTGKTVSLSLAASLLTSSVAYPADVTIITDGTKTEFKGAVTGPSMPSNPNITFTIPKGLYDVEVALPDGFAVSALAIDGVELVNIDLSPSEGLTELTLTNCNLSSIDLGYNRALTSLNLSGNNLSSLNLAGVRGDYEKFSLTNINLANNKLSSLSTVSASTITNLDLSGNLFTTFSLGYYTGLQSLNLSNNKIAGELDFSKVARIHSVDVSGNALTSLIFNTEDEALDNLVSLNVANNNLTFATLPLLNISGLNYTYAPQPTMQVLSTAPAINLSAQNIVVGGVGTTFTWKYYPSGENLPATLYANDGGAVVFDESLIGTQVYCQMTNPAFPAFNSAPLTTSPVTVAATPTVLVASFVTPETGISNIGFLFADTERDNAVYVDWRGDGSEYQPYIYPSTGGGGVYRTGQTIAGATAKVYVYDSADEVTGFFLMNTKLTSADLSPMTKVTAVDIHGAGLEDGSLILPKSNDLWELVLDGNNFVNQSFPGYPRISNLNLAGNKLTSIDLSIYPNVSFAQLADNLISEVKFGGNNSLYQLNLTNNNLRSISLEGAESAQEILLTNNYLTQIDLSSVKESVRTLQIAGNYFTFATLPRMADMGSQFLTYDYSNQKPMTVYCSEYKIDLSAQDQVNGVETQYYWFLGDVQGDVYYDYEEDSFVGEMLEGPADSLNPEYTIENGVTTFNEIPSRNVICAMTNSEYPSLILYTAPTQVTSTGISQLFGNETELVDVVTLNGTRVKTQVTVSEALQDLKAGIYIIGGKKILVK